MISVAKEDKDVLRLLWLDVISADLPRVRVLRFARVVFGVSSSPFLLNATVYHMDKYRVLDRQFVVKFECSIYVDDLTFRDNNERDALQLYKKVKEWLAEGAFNLRKFHTNCHKLQRQIDAQEKKVEVSIADEQSTVMEDLSYAKDMLGNYHDNKYGVKVLGVQWDSSSDQFVFNIQDICNAAEVVDPTKRTVIGIVSRFYDPLGVLAPLTIRFKIFFQKVCVKRVDWDQPLMGELLQEWKGLVTTLKQFQTNTIPRCFLLLEKRRVYPAIW